MALDASQLQALADIASAARAADEVATQWRARFPDVRVLRLDPDDLRDETPALRYPVCDVYFVRSGGVCLSMTTEASQTDALVFTPSREGSHGA